MGASLALQYKDKLDRTNDILLLLQDFIEFKNNTRSPITIYRHQQHDYFMARLALEFSDEVETANFHRKWSNFHQPLTKNIPNMFKVLHVSSPKIQRQKVYIYYEWTILSLNDEIIQKRKDSSIFKEEQIWGVLQAVCLSMDLLTQNGVSHGDICPKKIGIDYNKETKIWNNDFLFNGLQNYDLLLQTGQPQFYISPELLTQYQNPTTFELIRIDQVKSDVFSLGMTLLEMCSKVQSQQYYDYASLTINNKLIDQQLNRIRNFYSERLVTTVYQMIVFDFRERLNFEDLMNECQNYQKSKLNYNAYCYLAEPSGFPIPQSSQIQSSLTHFMMKAEFEQKMNQVKMNNNSYQYSTPTKIQENFNRSPRNHYSNLSMFESPSQLQNKVSLELQTMQKTNSRCNSPRVILIDNRPSLTPRSIRIQTSSPNPEKINNNPPTYFFNPTNLSQIRSPQNFSANNYNTIYF